LKPFSNNFSLTNVGRAILSPARRAKLALLPLAIAAAVAQQAPFTIEQALSAPFPSSLTASTTGAKVAWVSNVRGVRNIMVAEPPQYRARAITRYSADDGQELAELRWTSDAGAVVYTRGGELNPANDPRGVEEAVWIVPLDGGEPRRLGDGNSPSVSPKGDRVAFLHSGQVWLAPLDGKTPAARAFQTRGNCSRPVWSPDGARIAFSVARNDHSFIGIYDPAAHELRFLDASTDNDLHPAWSADSRSVAFVRSPSNGLRPVREARRSGTPWSIRIAEIGNRRGREIWRAREGRGSVYREVVSDSQLIWTADGRIVFPWEGDGWTHLYSTSPAVGDATPLTPGEFEVEDVSLAANGRDIVYSSNQGDIDRRHLSKAGSTTPLTSGEGIECKPAGDLAFLRADAQRPFRVAVRVGGDIRDVETPPADFPVQRMVKPRQVIFPSADGMQIHGQLFLPPNAPARAPALVFFHGGSRRQMMLGWHPMYYYFNAYALNQYLANAGYIVLSVNYRSGIGYGMEFREALNYGPSGASEYNDVQGAGVYLRSRSDVDPRRIGAWGGSYGGYLTALALARASDLFRAGVDFHGVHDWAREIHIPPGEPDYRIAYESSPIHFVKDWRSPVLLIHGDDDPDVQFNQTVMLKDALRRQKVDYEEMILPGEGHDFLMWRTWRDTYQATVDFFARKLK
jgi:dipeptidyl aminopeptidase/acylaminoacyl peptidase